MLPSRQSVLRSRNVSKSYGDGAARFQALRGVSLDIHAGESVAIVGKSGSGKSTLMHLLALLDSPDTGSIDVDGIDAKDRSRRALDTLRNETFGFVFQQFFMIPNATVLENVVLPLKIAGMPRRLRIARGMEVLEQVELADKAANRATALSGGQKQRMVIARALANRPKVIFADEPTGNLDSATGEVVIGLLFALNAQEGLTLVIVTHDEELAGRCDTRFVIADGLLARAVGPRSTVAA
ncbi:MAG: ABC transporter ATP-binding protein [Gemmatimonadaceae bacterium]|nr:ABC transporter ATP-binding protein [Gemmatimonadaceae bacterium]